eukprot:365154-Chlamydomonas_euryale.AAC.19
MASSFKRIAFPQRQEFLQGATLAHTAAGFLCRLSPLSPHVHMHGINAFFGAQPTDSNPEVELNSFGLHSASVLLASHTTHKTR